MTADLSHRFGQLAVVRKDRATIAETAKRLCRIKADSRNTGQAAHLPRADRGAEALCRIGDNGESVLYCHRFDGCVVCWEGIKINWHYDLRPQLATGKGHLYCPLYVLGRHIAGCRVDIREDRHTAGSDHRAGCGRERERRNKYR